MKVGQYIKKLRTEKGLTQEELGVIVGVQRAAVQKWESGSVQNLKRTTIQKLSEFFGVSPASFVDDDNYQTNELITAGGQAYRTSVDADKTTSPAFYELHEETNPIFISYSLLNDDDKKKVSEYIDLLLNKNTTSSGKSKENILDYRQYFKTPTQVSSLDGHTELSDYEKFNAADGSASNKDD